MRIIRWIPFLVLGLIGSIFLLPSGSEPVWAQGQNLLVNPGFEGQYSGYTPETAQELADCPLGVCSTAQTANGWKPWWVKERPTDVNPEFKPAQRNVAGNRVYSGERAAQYFSFWTTHKAGLRQTVNVPAGATVQFSVWGHAWLQEEDNSFVSDFAGTPNMRIGIDPSGGSSPYSPAIVWSEYKQAFDTYQPFSVQARAEGDKVTVFTFSAPSVNPNSPEYGFKHTNVYWDEASLVATGGAAPPPAQPAAPGGGNSQVSAPAPAAAPASIGPSPTPDAEGNIYAQVQPGDSIWAIAARAGLTLDEILALNNLGRDDFVHTGDLLLIGNAEPPPAEADAAAEEAAAESENADEATPEPVATPVDEASAEGIAMIEQAESGVGICLKAYDDVNQNGIHDGGEALRPAVAFTIADGQAVVSNYVTDGSSEPFCIQGLEPGDYNVTRSNLPEEVLTTPGDWAVSLTDGGALNLEFGSYVSEDALAMVDDSGQPAGSESGSEAAADSGGDSLNTAVIVAVVGSVLLLIAVAVYLLRSRGSQGETG
jgi:LysM repeat protein